MPEKHETIRKDNSPVVKGDDVWWTYGAQGMNTGKVVGYTDTTKLVALVKRGREHVQIPVEALRKLILQR